MSDPVRLEALHGLAILDTPPEEGFDDAVRLAARLCAAPIALVSLVAADRQWFKARLGFPSCETDLDRSVCKFALAEPDLLVVPDLVADPRTASNPLVTNEPHIRFYAGAPLRLRNGQAVGSLCVIDTAPRPSGLTVEQADDLRALARQVAAGLEMRRALDARDALLAEESRGRRERQLQAELQAAVGAAGSDLDAILDAVAVGAMSAIPAADGAAIGLLDDEAVEVRAVAGALLPILGLRLGPDGGFTDGRVLAGGTIRAEDAAHSRILAPIARAGRIVGVLRIEAASTGAFTERDVELARLVAGAATAGLTEVAEAEAERARRRAQDRLDLLARISAALLTATDPGRVIEPLLAAGIASLGFEQSYLYDVAPDGRHLALRHAVGASETVQSSLRRVDVDGPLCGIVAQTGQPLVLTGVLATHEPRYALARSVGINAFAGYPVVSRGATVGVISFCANAEPSFDAEALRFFATVARYLSGVRERLDGEAALRESDARSKRAQEAGQVGTFEVDVDTGLMSVSPEFARIYGRPPVGLYSTEAFEALIVPEDRAVGSSEQTRRDGSALEDVEYRIRRADDGTLRWIARRATFERDEAGRVIRMYGTVQDITVRKAAETRLAASEAHWRELFERLSEGFLVGEVVRDASGRITDWRYVEVNAAWGALVGLEPAQVIGRTVREVLPGVEDAWVDEFADVVRTGRPVAFTRQVGSLRRWYEGRVFPLGPDRFGVIFLEVTERLLAEARRDALLRLGDRLRELEGVGAMTLAACEVLGVTLQAERVAYGDVAPGADTVTVERDWTTGAARSLTGRIGLREFGPAVDRLKRGETVVVSDARTDACTRDRAAALEARAIRAFVNAPILERGVLVALLSVSSDRPRDWPPEELTLIREVASRLRNAVSRARSEEERDVLNQEMSHRLKNTLAMVMSIAGQTLRGVAERAPVEAFEQRVHALSNAHDVLLRRSWASASAREVAHGVLSGAGHRDRIAASGPDLDLGPRAALSLSLLLHELVTNAAKHGALSVGEGRVALDWRFEGEGEGREVVLEWCERGGPPPVPPAESGRRGFGSRLIRMGLVGAGGVELRYPPDGFEATMRAPVVQLTHG